MGKECTDVRKATERKSKEGGDEVGEVRGELEQVKDSLLISAGCTAS